MSNRNELLTLAKKQLAAGDYEWLSLDTFRIWISETTIGDDGMLKSELNSYDFKIEVSNHV